FLVGDDRRRRARALAVLDDAGGVAFHHGDARVRRPQVDADDLGHGSMLLKLCVCVFVAWRGVAAFRPAFKPSLPSAGGPDQSGPATVTSAGRSTRSAIR